MGGVDREEIDEEKGLVVLRVERLVFGLFERVGLFSKGVTTGEWREWGTVWVNVGGFWAVFFLVLSSKGPMTFEGPLLSTPRIESRDLGFKIPADTELGRESRIFCELFGNNIPSASVSPVCSCTYAEIKSPAPNLSIISGFR